jgi:predicted glutamine amidotransferase
MCIIAYKPTGVDMPSKSILETMYRNNPDGAGYMYIDGDKVRIKKGFMTFDSFFSSLSAYSSIWKYTPFVLHFRISTQAGINPQCTHPFPLSPDMGELKRLRCKSDVGIAHNGIISLTSSYSKDITYSDTMEFITEYLSLLIQNLKYWKSPATLEVIEKLAGSKLAILDKTGHCELIGKFIEDNGIFYSNDTYEDYTSIYSGYDWDYYDSYDYSKPTKTSYAYWEKFYDFGTRKYCFDDYCPADTDDDYSYCDECVNFRKCYASTVLKSEEKSYV